MEPGRVSNISSFRSCSASAARSSPWSAQHRGGRRERALRTAWIGAAMAVVLTEAIGLCAAAFPTAWLSLFGTDPAMLDAGARYLRAVGPFYGMLGLALSLYFASQAQADCCGLCRQSHAPCHRRRSRMARASLERQPVARVPCAEPCAGRLRN